MRHGLIGRVLGQPRLRRRWLVALLALALSSLPLVGTLGYESSLLFAPLLSLLGMAAGVDQVRHARSQTGIALRPLLVRGAFEVCALWLIAVACLLASVLWQRNCDPLGGLAFFAMGPLVSCALGWVCGIWAAVVTRRRIPALAVGALPFVYCLGVGLWRLYEGPGVYALDPFWGLFAGTLYDEDVGVGSRYRTFRLYNGLWAASVLACWSAFVDRSLLRASIRPHRPPLAAVGLLGLAAAVAISARADRFGFHASEDSLSEALPRTRVTEHFVIHYAARTPVAREIDAIAMEHEFAWSRLANTLGTEPAAPVHSFVFASPDQKRTLMGAGRVEVAPPWRGQLYLNHKPFPHPSLHHELAHAFEAAIGDPVFGLSLRGARLNMGLVEGLASALAPRTVDGLDIHDQAAVLDRLGKRPPLSQILGTGFWASASRHAYTAAGSFVGWLLQEHGAPAVVDLYGSGGDFQGSLGVSLESLERSWVDFLGTRRVADETVAAMEQRFRVRPIFQRPCAHRVARLARDAARARNEGNVDEAVDARRTLCRIEPEQPVHKLGLADELALGNRFGEARQVLTELLQDGELTSGIRAGAGERQGDVALAVGDLSAARDGFGRALQNPVGDDAARILELKYRAAGDPELAPLVATYFGRFADNDDGLVRAVQRAHMAQRIRALPGQRALGSYLLGLQLINVQAYEEAVHLLERALETGSSEGALSQPFVRAARRRLLAAYLVTDRLARAEALLAESERDPELRTGDRADHALWRQRLAYWRARGPGDRSLKVRP